MQLSWPAAQPARHRCGCRSWTRLDLAPDTSIPGKLASLGVASALATKALGRKIIRQSRHVRCTLLEAATARRAYKIVPHETCNFGGYVHDFDLREAINDPALMEQVKKDMRKYRLLVFRGQNDLSGEDHISLSEQLGSLDHILHRPHPQAPDPRLLRVSNHKAHGFVSVGTSGWHVDGVMLQTPFSAQTMHHIAAIPEGNTYFLGMNEFLNSVDDQWLEQARRMWFVSGVGDLGEGDGQLSIIPLVYKHPYTGIETMCFHLGRQYCLGWLEETPSTILGEIFSRGEQTRPTEKLLQQLMAGPNNDSPGNWKFRPPAELQQSIQKAIDRMTDEAREKAIMEQSWAAGDMALIDNMALAHLPSKGTQKLPIAGGLRVFHRTTMVDEKAVPRNYRDAPAILLAGGKKKDSSQISKSAIPNAKALRMILNQLLAVTPSLDDDGGQIGGQQNRRDRAALDEVTRAIEAAGLPLAPLMRVDEEVENARAKGPEAFGKELKRLMREFHPDLNPTKVKEVRPIFTYLRELRREQNQSRSTMQNKADVLSRLRKKAEKVANFDVELTG